MVNENYIKYFSNGDLDKLNQHYCVCCKKLKNNMEIFVFNLMPSSQSFGSWITTLQSPFSNNTGKQYYKSLAPHNTGNQVYLCAECILEMYKKISQETLNNLMVDKL